MDKELYLCKVDSDYIDYLHGIDYRVSLKHNRPFIGIITMINGIKYIIPLTSQTTQLREKAGKKKRAAQITTFVRDSSGVEIANILHNNMIPIKDEYYTTVDIDVNSDTYESNEIRFIRKNKDKIIKKANKVHDDRILKKIPFLINYCCDFSKLEEEYVNYKKGEN